MSKVQMRVPPSDLYLSIRGIQYAFHEALADLVDNSLDAGATRVWIKADKNEVVIADDGDGMGVEDLEVAITPWRAGAKSEKLRRGKRGKFGIGLKSASYSLGDCLEIHTKLQKGKFEHIELDRDKIAKINNTDHMFSTSNTVTDLFKSYCKDGHGTILHITKINKRKVSEQGIGSLKNLLGLVYFKMIENGDLKIMVNNQEVKPLDPLMRGLKKNQSINKYELFDRKSITVDFEGAKATFKIQGAYVGRGAFWTEEDFHKYKYFVKGNRKSESDEDLPEKPLLKLDEQGIYTLRNGRLITLGGWLGLASSNTLLHHNTPARVLLEFDENGDALMGLDNTKTQLKVELVLKDKLGSYLAEIINDSSKLFRREGELITKRNANKAIKALNLKKDSAVAQHKLEERRKKAMPDYDKRQDDLEKEQSKDAKGTEHLVEVKEKLPSNVLWDAKPNKSNEILLLLNEQHPGYAALFLEDDETKLRKNLHHFFYTLGLHELSIQELHSDQRPIVRDELEKAFKTFRRWVSKHFTEF